MRIARKQWFSKILIFIALCIAMPYFWLRKFHNKLQIKTERDGNKHILIWIPKSQSNQFGKVRTISSYFSDGKLETPPSCPYQNCYVKVGDDTIQDRYDAVLFDGTQLKDLKSDELPKERNPNQIFIFAQIQPADMYPVCQPFLDEIFNLTMTYKLDSVIPWTFFKVKNLKNEIVAPSTNARRMWPGAMAPVDEHFIDDLKTKKFLAASIVTNYDDETYWMCLKAINVLLTRRYNQTSVDIFGPRDKFPSYENDAKRYNTMLRRDYFFYMTIENSTVKDFVTDAVLVALNNNVVPIVWGKSNYGEFLPPGSYIDARRHNATSLIELMLSLKANLTAYTEYFRWRSYYTIYNTRGPASIACRLCSILNHDPGLTRIDDLRDWWNQDFSKHCGPQWQYN